MGRRSYCLTFISDGDWSSNGNKWVFQGKKTTKALVVSEGITYELLREKLEEKINLNRERYVMELKYLTPERPNLPPFGVNDDDDFEAFKFINLQSNDAVWPVELYASLKLKGEKECGNAAYLCRQQIHEAENTLSLTPPSLIHNQETQALIRDQPHIHVGNIDMNGKEKVIDLAGLLETESKSDGEETGSLIGRKRGSEHIDSDFDFEEGDFEGEEWIDDSQGSLGDDIDDVDNLSVDFNDEALQEIEADYYHINKCNQRQTNDIEEPKGDEGASRTQLEIKVGDYFDSKKHLKDHLSLMALQKRFQMHVQKSDKGLYVVKCIYPGCSFFCRGSKFRQTGLFMVRKFCGEHTCGMKIKHNHHKHASSSIIADHIMSSFDTTTKGEGLRTAEIQDLMKEMGVNASYHKANRARLAALDRIRGTAKQSYKWLHGYLHILEKVNPGTITHVELDANQRFKFCFFTLGALRRGIPFLRKVISVDGTHLSSKYRGVLLLALAQDGNKQIYPLAFAIVDSENDSSWSYFFRHLRSIVPDENDVVFVSDRHGSIIKGLRDNYFFAKQGYCTFHLFQNLKVKFKRADLWGLYQKMNKAYTKQEFNRHYTQLCLDSPQVGTYLKEVGFHTWARSYFPANRFNIGTTNNAECFNNVIKKARGWPVISLIDGILEVIVRWFYERREMGQNSVEAVTPTISKELDLNYLRSLSMVVGRINQYEFQVHSSGTKFLVNLHARTCYCNAFQIDQIPCPHAIAAAKDIGVDPIELVHPFFTADKWKEVYKETVYPVPPIDRWEVPDLVMNITCLPPMVRKKSGRPRKNRIPSRGDYRGQKRRCGSCRARGHNQRNCPNRSTSAAAP